MIYITGDTHRDASRLSKSALSQLKENDTLIICGDFGFIWDGDAKETKLLRDLSSRKYRICFLDGTHENFDKLHRYPEEIWKDGRIRRIGDNLFYLMRGEIYQIEGYKIFTMGGGESPDMDMRFGTDRFSRYEMPSQEELLNGLTNIEKAHYTVDFILTHEPPLKTKEFLNLGNQSETRLSSLNSYFDELSKLCKYKHWYFGSMHMDKRITEKHTAVFKKIYNAATGETI